MGSEATTGSYCFAVIERAQADLMTDQEVVDRVLHGDTPLFEILMRRYNQRVYRVARAVLGSDAEAEDVMQEAWVRAYTHLQQFAGRARFSTWLARIAAHEAYARARRSGRTEPIDGASLEGAGLMSALSSPTRDPERQVLDRELSLVLEAAIEALPEIYRSVFVLREIEGVSTAETGECLGITEEAVKARLHRARALLRAKLYTRFGAAAAGVFHFHFPRCDRVVQDVFRRLLPHVSSTIPA
ncbi:MAG TPA: RNA polymerase sigma factor [Bryobacterales bacterium]|nr:RNA polymerase sigma factor [Bryobacterales bacterium]